mmetsp:Transcript_31597/g.94204  ORF Transcript_31597/g.94204 Transcript_31597/m.94204 type:complete len:200 (-) Transcript_31597:394-993(-)
MLQRMYILPRPALLLSAKRRSSIIGLMRSTRNSMSSQVSSSRTRLRTRRAPSSIFALAEMAFSFLAWSCAAVSFSVGFDTRPLLALCLGLLRCCARALTFFCFGICSAQASSSTALVRSCLFSTNRESIRYSVPKRVSPGLSSSFLEPVRAYWRTSALLHSWLRTYFTMKRPVSTILAAQVSLPMSSSSRSRQCAEHGR